MFPCKDSPDRMEVVVSQIRNAPNYIKEVHVSVQGQSRSDGSCDVADEKCTKLHQSCGCFCAMTVQIGHEGGCILHLVAFHSVQVWCGAILVCNIRSETSKVGLSHTRIAPNFCSMKRLAMREESTRLEKRCNTADENCSKLVLHERSQHVTAEARHGGTWHEVFRIFAGRQKDERDSVGVKD